jgi:hypothetical protein
VPAIVMPLIPIFHVFGRPGDDTGLLATIGVCFLIGWICLGFCKTEEPALKWIWFAIYPFLCLGLPFLLLFIVIGIAMS